MTHIKAKDWSDLKMFLKTQSVLKEVLRERVKQDGKWGEQNHDPFQWLAILGEEVGEANKAAVDANTWRNISPVKFNKDGLENYRAELIQVAAVAVSMVECLDRNKWENTKWDNAKTMAFAIEDSKPYGTVKVRFGAQQNNKRRTR